MSFIYKYKLYHLPFWFAYHFMWWTLTIGSASLVLDKIFHSPYVFKFLFGVLFQAIGVYFNLYFLMPRFLEKGRVFSIYGLSPDNDRLYFCPACNRLLRHRGCI